MCVYVCVLENIGLGKLTDTEIAIGILIRRVTNYELSRSSFQASGNNQRDVIIIPLTKTQCACQDVRCKEVEK